MCRKEDDGLSNDTSKIFTVSYRRPHCPGPLISQPTYRPSQSIDDSTSLPFPTASNGARWQSIQYYLLTGDQVATWRKSQITLHGLASGTTYLDTPLALIVEQLSQTELVSLADQMSTEVEAVIGIRLTTSGPAQYSRLRS